MKYYSLIKNILNKTEINRMIFVLFLMIISSFLDALSIGVLIPLLAILTDSGENYYLQALVENFFIGFEIEINIYIFVIVILSVYIIKYLFTLYFVREQAKFVLNLKADLSTRIYADIINKRYMYFIKNETATLIRNVSKEVNTYVNGFISPILALLLSLFTVVFLVALLFTVNPIVTTAITIIFVVLNFFTVKIFSNTLNRFGVLRQYHEKHIYRNLLQSLKSIQDVKMFKLESFFLNNFYHHHNNLAKQTISKSIMGAFPKIIFEFFLLLTTMLLITYFAFNSLSLNDLFAHLLIYAAAAFRILPAITGIARHQQKLRFAIPAAQVLINQIESSVDKEKNIQNNFYKVKFDKELNLKNISFSYDKRKMVLNNFNLKINKGEQICLRGKNGSGKSTLIKIIAGLIKPDSGSISVDGKDIFSINTKNWTNLVGYISQDINLFDGSLIKNIGIGLDENKIDNKKIEYAIEKAFLNDFVKKYGLNTNIGEDGKKISGGEKQKIALARVLYRSAEFLIFDEVTKAMDIKSETLFFDNVRNLFDKKTVILITHNEYHEKFFDKVINLDNLNK